jgi:hypothetical protein
MVYNLIATVSFFAAIINFLLGGYVIKLNSKSRINKVFLYLSICLGSWIFVYGISMLLYNNENYWICREISSIPFCFYPFIILHFFMILTDKKGILTKKWTYIFIYMLSIIFMYEKLNDIFIINKTISIGLELENQVLLNSPWDWAFTVYNIGCTVLSIYFVYQWKHRTNLKREKKS